MASESDIEVFTTPRTSSEKTAFLTFQCRDKVNIYTV